MSSQLSAESPSVGGAAHTRRELNPRQADTVARVLAAAHEELRAVGYDALTIRGVAARAGVAPATAYTYFGSKNHLVAELFARRMADHLGAHRAVRPHDGDPASRTEATQRVIELVQEVTSFLAAEPELASAVTPALLGNDPDVQHLRLRIGGHWGQLFAAALGPRTVADHPDVLDTLMLVLSGGLLQAGMGVVTYPQLGERLTRTVRVIMEDPR